MGLLAIVVVIVGLYFSIVIKENKNFSSEVKKNTETIKELYNRIIV